MARGEEEVTDGNDVPKVLRNTGNNEWFTPSYIVDAAREVMGGIDVDPASCELANARHVGADRFYSAEDDGLAHDWFGRVWMNPPYSNGLLRKFVQKLASQIAAGNVTQATVLVNNGTETRWCQELFGMSDGACFIRGRVQFYRPDGTTGPPLQGQVIFYVGDEPMKFLDVFSGLGAVALVTKRKEVCRV